MWVVRPRPSVLPTPKRKRHSTKSSTLSAYTPFACSSRGSFFGTCPKTVRSARVFVRLTLSGSSIQINCRRNQTDNHLSDRRLHSQPKRRTTQSGSSGEKLPAFCRNTPVFYRKRGRRRRKWGSDFANFRFVRRSHPVSVTQLPCFCTLCAPTQSGYPVEIYDPPLSPTAFRTTEFDMASE